MFDVPILILAFNRPETTAKVLETLQKSKAQRIYVCVDGARTHKDGEKEKVQAVQDLFENLPWAEEVHTLFRPANLGCRDSVRGAIDWFFESVEYGIILEDDCVPHPSFFPFCEALLLKYKADNSVFQIAGFNPISFDKKESYFFSDFSLIWGWATWRRAWQHNDPSFKGLKDLENSTHFQTLLPNQAARAYMMDKFENVKNGSLNSWAYAWFHTILQQKGRCIMPAKNLIQNIGFGSEATNTSRDELGTAQTKATAMDFPLSHPEEQAQALPEENLKLFYATQKKQWLLIINQVLPKKWVRLAGQFLNK